MQSSRSSVPTPVVKLSSPTYTSVCGQEVFLSCSCADVWGWLSCHKTPETGVVQVSHAYLLIDTVFPVTTHFFLPRLPTCDPPPQLLDP